MGRRLRLIVTVLGATAILVFTPVVLALLVNSTLVLAFTLLVGAASYAIGWSVLTADRRLLGRPGQRVSLVAGAIAAAVLWWRDGAGLPISSIHSDGGIGWSSLALVVFGALAICGLAVIPAVLLWLFSEWYLGVRRPLSDDD